MTKNRRGIANEIVEMVYLALDAAPKIFLLL